MRAVPEIADTKETVSTTRGASGSMTSMSKNLAAEDKVIEASEAVTEAVLNIFVDGMITQADLSRIYKNLSEWTLLGIQIIESVRKPSPIRRNTFVECVNRKHLRYGHVVDLRVVTASNNSC